MLVVDKSNWSKEKENLMAKRKYGNLFKMLFYFISSMFIFYKICKFKKKGEFGRFIKHP